MSEDKDLNILMECLLKVKTLEKILISKNIITEEELSKAFKDEVEIFAEFIVKAKKGN